MASRQVKDILDHIRACHHKMSEKLTGSGGHQSDERLGLLLKYMARHEQHFDDALADYEKDAAKGVLDTWLPFVNEETLDAALKNIEFRDDMTPDEIVGAILEFDKSLLELYRELASETSIPHVRELFLNLLEMEENKDHQYARSVLDI